jgi:hypothetical protein
MTLGPGIQGLKKPFRLIESWNEAASLLGDPGRDLCDPEIGSDPHAAVFSMKA